MIEIIQYGQQTKQRVTICCINSYVRSLTMNVKIRAMHVKQEGDCHNKSAALTSKITVHHQDMGKVNKKMHTMKINNVPPWHFDCRSNTKTKQAFLSTVTSTSMTSCSFRSLLVTLQSWQKTKYSHASMSLVKCQCKFLFSLQYI